MDMEQLRSTAYHEAGHAIVGWALKLQIHRLRIGIQGDAGKGAADMERNEALSLVDRIAICYGGIAAQAMLQLETHELAGMMDGIELATLAKARFPDLHVIVTSGAPRVRRLPDGTTFMAKPWSPIDVLIEAQKSDQFDRVAVGSPRR